MNFSSLSGGGSSVLHKYFYLPDGWNDTWVAAKANNANTPAWLTGIGDSVMIGQNASNYLTKSFFSLLRTNLLTKYSLYGDFYSMDNTSNWGNVNASSPSFPIVVNAVSPSTTYAVFGRTISFGSNLAFPAVTFTTPYACTQVDIYYVDYASGTWGYNVDGGSTTIVTNTGPGTAAGAIVKKVSLTGLSNTTHTIQVGGAGASQNANVPLFAGFACYSNPAAGVGFANMGVNGMGIFTGAQTNNNLSDQNKWPVDRVALYQGYQGTTASPTAQSGFGFPTQPALAIIQFNINDIVNGTTETNFKEGYRRLIHALRYGYKNCSILFHIPWLADGDVASSTIVTSTDYTAGQYPTYRDMIRWIYELAFAYKCAILNTHAKWGVIPVTDGNVHSATDIHPTDQGYADVANDLNTIL